MVIAKVKSANNSPRSRRTRKITAPMPRLNKAASAAAITRQTRIGSEAPRLAVVYMPTP